MANDDLSVFVASSSIEGQTTITYTFHYPYSLSGGLTSFGGWTASVQPALYRDATIEHEARPAVIKSRLKRRDTREPEEECVMAMIVAHLESGAARREPLLSRDSFWKQRLRPLGYPRWFARQVWDDVVPEYYLRPGPVPRCK